jgi:hypothetical protein
MAKFVVPTSGRKGGKGKKEKEEKFIEAQLPEPCPPIHFN